MSEITVILADDHPIVRRGIRNMIEGAVGIKVLGEASLGKEALDMVEQMAPEVLLLDMELPDMTGNDVIVALKEKQSPTIILALSAFLDKEFITQSLVNGAAGYLVKDEVPENIIEAIRGVARGERGWVSRQVAAHLSTWMQEQSEQDKKLTPRETEVLNGVVNGKTNQEISYSLGISEKTVEKYLDRIYTKLNVASRVEAAVMAVREGWL
jgi:DNA-binding NarL/FixJ family response regulator